MPWKHEKFKSQVKAQAFVKTLMKAGLDSALDIHTEKQGDHYIVHYKTNGYGIFGA